MKIKYYFPLLAGLAVLFTIVCIIYLSIENITGGKLIYDLDDAYIYLAVSKNVALHNVWGITSDHFSSATTSPVWTLLTALIFLVTGVNDFVPLVLNLIFASLLLHIVFVFLKEHSVSGFYNGAVLITMILVVPLSFFIFSGMEHILHAILTILFIKYSAESLSQNPAGHKITKKEKYLLLTAFFLSGVRYEGVILLLIVAFLYAFRKRYLFALILIASGSFIMIAFGIYSIYHGGSFLPNSVLLKSNLHSLKNAQTIQAFENPREYISLSRKLIFFLILSLVLFFMQIRLTKKFMTEIPLMLFILISIIIIQRAGTPVAYFRYDAYLIIAAIAVDALAIYDYCRRKFKVELSALWLRQNKIALSIFIIYTICLIYKSFDFEKTVISSKNIYEQQYQMSRFIDKFYRGKNVALNDIGAVNYFSEINCIDLMGIAGNEILQLRLNGSFDSDHMHRIAAQKRVDIAVIYDDWFNKNGGIPEDWIRAGQWTITDNHICGSDRVSFYAVSRDEIEGLKANLNSFSDELPADVLQGGSYLTDK